MNEPLDHIERSPLPWRTGRGVTECGRPVEDCAQVISRDDALAKWKTQGLRRAVLSTCMSCIDTANRWPTFEENPVERIARETYMGRRTDDLFRRELLALAALARAHSDEFQSMVEGLAEAPQLSEQRARRRVRGSSQ